MRTSANVFIVFKEVPFLERFEEDAGARSAWRNAGGLPKRTGAGLRWR